MSTKRQQQQLTKIAWVSLSNLHCGERARYWIMAFSGVDGFGIRPRASAAKRDIWTLNYSYITTHIQQNQHIKMKKKRTRLAGLEVKSGNKQKKLNYAVFLR